MKRSSSPSPPHLRLIISRPHNYHPLHTYWYLPISSLSLWIIFFSFFSFPLHFHFSLSLLVHKLPRPMVRGRPPLQPGFNQPVKQTGSTPLQDLLANPIQFVKETAQQYANNEAARDSEPCAKRRKVMTLDEYSIYKLHYMSPVSNTNTNTSEQKGRNQEDTIQKPKTPENKNSFPSSKAIKLLEARQVIHPLSLRNTTLTWRKQAKPNTERKYEQKCEKEACVADVCVSSYSGYNF